MNVTSEALFSHIDLKKRTKPKTESTGSPTGGSCPAVGSITPHHVAPAPPPPHTRRNEIDRWTHHGVVYPCPGGHDPPMRSTHRFGHEEDVVSDVHDAGAADDDQPRQQQQPRVLTRQKERNNMSSEMQIEDWQNGTPSIRLCFLERDLRPVLERGTYLETFGLETLPRANRN